MNPIMKRVAAATLMGSAMFSQAAFAAEQKIGVVNIQAVFQQIPQAAQIQTDVREEFKDQLEEVSRLEKDINYYMEKQQRDTATMSQKEKDDLDKQLNDLREQYAGAAQPLQQDIQRRVAEERNKLLGLIKQSVDSIAADEKYDIILNSTAVAFIDDAFDLSTQVVDQVSKIK